MLRHFPKKKKLELHRFICQLIQILILVKKEMPTYNRSGLNTENFTPKMDIDYTLKKKPTKRNNIVFCLTKIKHINLYQVARCHFQQIVELREPPCKRLFLK